MMEEVEYKGWANCIRLSNGKMELIVVTDIGPRIIRCGFIDGQNMFKEFDEQMGNTGEADWQIRGGHRLWHAPEVKPRTYWADNVPVDSAWDGTTLKTKQPVEGSTGIVKEMEITLDAESNKVTVLHKLTNTNMWDIELSPWALSVMNNSGRAIFPQEPYIAHNDYLIPARPMVMWHFANMADPRWSWGEKYIQLKQDPTATTKNKIGLLNKQCWAAYTRGGDVFIKRFEYEEGANYPDYGCNMETYTDPDILEIESLGPLAKLPAGGSVELTEKWFMFQAEVGDTDEAIDKDLLPLVKETE